MPTYVTLYTSRMQVDPQLGRPPINSKSKAGAQTPHYMTSSRLKTKICTHKNEIINLSTQHAQGGTSGHDLGFVILRLRVRNRNIYSGSGTLIFE